MQRFEDLEGLWTARFKSNFQTFGTGVVVFTKGRILGGDHSYYYDGSTTLDGSKLQADIKVVRFNEAGMAIFGNLNSFNLKVIGDIHANKMELHGHMVEQSNMKISIMCEKAVSI